MTPSLLPLFRYVGGKRWLVPALRTGIRAVLSRTPDSAFVEPFAGGAAMAAAVAWQRTTLCDRASGLTDLYCAVRDDPDGVISASAKVCDDFPVTEAGYYAARDAWNTRSPSPVRQAALLLYLMARGFNGLYRVNAVGSWNVPCGRRADHSLIAASLVDPDLLREWSRVTTEWTIVCADFARPISDARRGDVIFADPPYAKMSASSFVGYSGVFGPGDQIRLAVALSDARDRGAVIVHTNADDPDGVVRDLYRGRGFHVVPTAELRCVSRDGEGRGRSRCLLVVSDLRIVSAKRVAA